MDYNNFNNNTNNNSTNDANNTSNTTGNDTNSYNAYNPYEANYQNGPQMSNAQADMGQLNKEQTYDINMGGQNKKPKKKKKTAAIVAVAAAALLLLSGTVGGSIYVAGRFLDNTRKIQSQAEQTVEQIEQVAQNQIENTPTTQVNSSVATSDVSTLVENVMPSIVAINNTAERVTSFWGQQFTQEEGGSGTGIIIGQNSKEVLIVTNNHVVATSDYAKNQKIEVVFSNEKSVPATIKGTEAGSDLAVIAVEISDIDAETLDYIKVATIGDSEALKVGEMAIAIGNALGYGQSLSVGYISALNREVATEDYTMALIQTDAAINPGNSGGPLLNIRGEVIGINSVKYASSEVEGMGFAIPISDALPIINDLMNREEIPEAEQAYLGIVGHDVDNGYHTRYGMPMGVYVYQITPDSPAEKSGLKMGDIITEFNGRKVESMSDLQRVLGSLRGGTEVTMKVQVFENGSYTEETLNVTLGYKNN